MHGKSLPVSTTSMEVANNSTKCRARVKETEMMNEALMLRAAGRHAKTSEVLAF